ncbi:SRPBCC family protein [Thermotoga caldifontis]|uniref:SRPBCC family protein n=1 Tax=Thermotoga caldifontis TaxID=1508419 RepID=UPI000597768B|nr:SRPBCC domain-containing protein [Thermotoga caldifontis]
MLQTVKMHFVEHFRVPVERLWNIFVCPNGWDPWFTDGMSMELFEGGQIRFRWKRITADEVVEDRGVVVFIQPLKVFEFWWYEYEDGFRSRVKMTFTPDGNEGTWLKVEDSVLIDGERELPIALGCAYGWGQMLCLAKAYAERGLILI